MFDHMPYDEYIINEYVINRVYNKYKSCFGGKDYVDVITSPYYMTDFESLPAKDRKMIKEFMRDKPVKKI